MPYPFKVTNARGSLIDNRRLATLRRIARGVPGNLSTDAEVEWLLGDTPELLDELAQRRAWMDQFAPNAIFDNVIVLPHAG